MVKKMARAARAMVTRVVGDKEGDGDRGNMARNNDDGLVSVIVQHSSSTSLYNAGDNKSTGRQLLYLLRTNNVGDDQTTTRMMTTSSCFPLMLRCPLVFLSLVSPLGA